MKIKGYTIIEVDNIKNLPKISECEVIYYVKDTDEYYAQCDNVWYNVERPGEEHD